MKLSQLQEELVLPLDSGQNQQDSYHKLLALSKRAMAHAPWAGVLSINNEYSIQQ